MQFDLIGSTPRKLGYAMPAEWERHDALWLAWPHDPTTFRRMESVENTYVKIIGAVQESERINLFVRDREMKGRASALLAENGIDPGRINFTVFDYADVWIRDYGPVFVVNRERGELAMVHWTFNAWGEKYRELMRDAQIPSIINREMRLNYFRPGIVLEGGSVDVNGRGTLLTTEQTLLNRNRNPRLTKSEIEKYLKEYLGASSIIWLKGGIAGDDTDGHIDDIARFVSPTTVLCAYEEDEADANHSSLKKNYELLVESSDGAGKPLEVIKLPMPGPVGDSKERLPASYANFYVGNKVILVPTFGHENDRRALDIIQGCFPDRRTVGIDCTDLVYGLGAIHCITQQQPAVARSEPKD